MPIIQLVIIQKERFMKIFIILLGISSGSHALAYTTTEYTCGNLTYSTSERSPYDCRINSDKSPISGCKLVTISGLRYITLPAKGPNNKDINIPCTKSCSSVMGEQDCENYSPFDVYK